MEMILPEKQGFGENESVAESMDVNTTGDNATMSFLMTPVNGSLETEARTSLNTVTLGMMLYLLPVIFTFGIFGNWVSFAVFLSQKMRRVSTNVYLAALCASNSIFLLAVMVVWTDIVGLKLMHRPVLCQATVYLTYCSSFLSVWLMVCITVENFVINFSLRKASKHCTVRRALGMVVLLLVTSFLLYDFAIWSTGIVTVNATGSPTQYCATFPQYQSLVETFTIVDTSVTHIVPTVVIVALVVPTCVKNICRTSRGASPSTSAGGAMLSRKERALLRVTRLLCVIIVSFVVLTTPTHVNKLRHLVLQQTRSQKAGSDDMSVVLICQVFYHLSFSLNFIYFLIWGKNFRGVCCRLLTSGYKLICRCRKKLLYVGVATRR